jgi:hypothetical protein
MAFWLTDWIVGILERTDLVEDASMTMISFPVRYSLQLILVSVSCRVSKSVTFSFATSM